MSHGIVVTATIVMPRVVLQLLLLHCMWCCSCCCRTAHGVTGAVIGLCYVVVVVAMPRAVSRSLLSCRVVLSSRSWSLCCMLLWSWLLHHVWCRGHGRHLCGVRSWWLCHAVWS